MTELIERLIKIFDMQLLPSKDTYLSGRLGILVQKINSSYFVTVISKDNLHLSAEGLQDLRRQLEKDPLTGTKIDLYLSEVTELRDKNLTFATFHIFVTKEKEK